MGRVVPVDAGREASREVMIMRELMWGTVLVAVAVMTFVGYIALFN